VFIVIVIVCFWIYSKNENMKMDSSAHQCTSSRCTECAEVQAQGFTDDKVRMIQNKPHPSLVFSTLLLISQADQFGIQEVSSSFVSVPVPSLPKTLSIPPLPQTLPIPPPFPSAPADSLKQLASEIVGPWIQSSDPHVFIRGQSVHRNKVQALFNVLTCASHKLVAMHISARAAAFVAVTLILTPSTVNTNTNTKTSSPNKE
jgi:hypothetical protein